MLLCSVFLEEKEGTSSYVPSFCPLCLDWLGQNAHVREGCHAQQSSSGTCWLWWSIAVVHGSLALCLSFLEPGVPVQREPVKESNTKLVAWLLLPVRLTGGVDWESMVKKIFTKSYWVGALISCDWIMLPCPFRVFMVWLEDEHSIISIFLKMLWIVNTWHDTHFICVHLPLSVYSVLLSESELLKPSLSSPKATDSDVSCVQNVSSPCKSVVLAVNF